MIINNDIINKAIIISDLIPKLINDKKLNQIEVDLCIKYLSEILKSNKICEDVFNYINQKIDLLKEIKKSSICEYDDDDIHIYINKFSDSISPSQATRLIYQEYKQGGFEVSYDINDKITSINL